MPPETRAAILSPSTLIPVGVLFALLTPLILGVWTASGAFSEFTNRLSSLERTVRYESWTYEMEKDAWTEFQRANPSLTIPDYRRIKSEHAQP